MKKILTNARDRFEAKRLLLGNASNKAIQKAREFLNRWLVHAISEIAHFDNAAAAILL
jgi:hypothetical protein